MPIKAVLFDHDGTLVDSEIIHFSHWRDVLRRHGAELSQDEFCRRYVGVPVEANAQDMVRRFGLSATAQTLLDDKEQATADFLRTQAFPLMPGVIEVIEACRRQRLDLAVVTGGGAPGVVASLREYACFSHFTTMVTSDDVAHSKPAPDVYLLAMQRLGLPPEACLAIEDTQAGVSAARAAGLRCLAVPNDMSRAHDFSAATGRCSSLQAALGWIEQQS